MRNAMVFALNPTSRKVVFSYSGPGDFASSFNRRNWLLLMDFAIILGGAGLSVDGILIVDLSDIQLHSNGWDLDHCCSFLFDKLTLQNQQARTHRQPREW